MPASANPARTDARASAATCPGRLLTRYVICDHMNEPDERGRVVSEGAFDFVDATEPPILNPLIRYALVEDDRLQGTWLRPLILGLISGADELVPAACRFRQRA
jgi:hypothetical protein